MVDLVAQADKIASRQSRTKRGVGEVIGVGFCTSLVKRSAACASAGEAPPQSQQTARSVRSMTGEVGAPSHPPRVNWKSIEPDFAVILRLQSQGAHRTSLLA